MSLDDTVKPDDWKDVKIPSFGGLKLSLDADNLEMTDLTVARNVRIVDDVIVPAVSYEQYHATVITGTPMTTFQFHSTDGLKTSLLFTTTNVYRDTGTAWSPIAGADLTGGVGDRFSVVAAPWADQVVFTNGIDKIQLWDYATDTINDLSGLPTDVRAKALAIFDNSLFLLNCTEASAPKPQRIRYCDQGDLTEWITGTAGFQDLMESTAPIVCGRQLGPYLMIYRERGIHRVAVSDRTDRRFDIDQMIADNGTLSIDGVIQIEKNRNLIWGRDNFYMYAGGYDLEPIGDDVYNVLFGESSVELPSRRHMHHLMYLEEINEIIAVYMATGDTTLTSAFTYRQTENKWYSRVFSHAINGGDKSPDSISLSWNDLVGDWNAQVGTWDDLVSAADSVNPIFASTTNTYQFAFTATLDDATQTVKTVETKDFSEYPKSARLDWLDVRLSGSDVEVYFSIDEGGTWTLSRVSF